MSLFLGRQCDRALGETAALQKYKEANDFDFQLSTFGFGCTSHGRWSHLKSAHLHLHVLKDAYGHSCG